MTIEPSGIVNALEPKAEETSTFSNSEEEQQKLVAAVAISKQQQQPTNLDDNQQQQEISKITITTAYKASWWEQFQALLWRSFITNSREPMITRIKLSQTIVNSMRERGVGLSILFTDLLVYFLRLWHYLWASSIGISRSIKRVS